MTIAGDIEMLVLPAMLLDTLLMVKIMTYFMPSVSILYCLLITGAIPKTSQGIASYALLYPLIGDVNCRGDENSLVDCGVSSAYRYNCYLAGVTCKGISNLILAAAT